LFTRWDGEVNQAEYDNRKGEDFVIEILSRLWSSLREIVSQTVCLQIEVKPMKRSSICFLDSGYLDLSDQTEDIIEDFGILKFLRVSNQCTFDVFQHVDRAMLSQNKQGGVKKRKSKGGRLAAIEAAVLRIEAKIGEVPLTGGQKERKRKKAPAAPLTIESGSPNDKWDAVSSDGDEESQAGLAAKRPC
uniref:Uncharacterized protein n=1 Tax=Romanomermis culicivorax TaxID=13658 RepID=A0A915I7Y9_ROMCU